MDITRRTEWAKALRSGKYAQAHGVLRDTRDLMCCLGVAIDVFCPSNWQSRDGVWADRGADIMLPTAPTREQLDLTEAEVSMLADLNDAEQRSFEEIARHIERNEDLAVEFDDENKELHGRSSRTR